MPETSSQPAPPPDQAHISEASTARSLRTSRAKPPKDPKFSNYSVKIHRIPDGVDPGDPAFQHVMRMQLMKEGALSDARPVNPGYEENARMLNIKKIQPSKDPNHLFTTNPVVYCGLASFSMLTDFEAAGIKLCNWHKSIWPTAHLYNALQQTSLISQSWPEMDKLIDLHMEIYSRVRSRCRLMNFSSALHWLLDYQ